MPLRAAHARDRALPRVRRRRARLRGLPTDRGAYRPVRAVQTARRAAGAVLSRVARVRVGTVRALVSHGARRRIDRVRGLTRAPGRARRALVFAAVPRALHGRAGDELLASAQHDRVLRGDHARHLSAAMDAIGQLKGTRAMRSNVALKPSDG
eukprot:31198-Pelagococcus_subviridis.AAC.2